MDSMYRVKGCLQGAQLFPSLTVTEILDRTGRPGNCPEGQGGAWRARLPGQGQDANRAVDLAFQLHGRNHHQGASVWNALQVRYILQVVDAMG